MGGPAHACAGHAVAIAGLGGCFQCHIGRTGSPSFRVVEWPDGDDANQEEPALWRTNVSSRRRSISFGKKQTHCCEKHRTLRPQGIDLTRSARPWATPAICAQPTPVANRAPERLAEFQPI